MHCVLISVSKVLEAELASHEARIDGVTKMAMELVSGGHFASVRINESNQELLFAWTKVKELANQRSQMLNDSLAVQQVHIHRVRSVCRAFLYCKCIVCTRCIMYICTIMLL